MRQRLQEFEVPAEPHFDPDSTAFFNDRIRAARSYVEYGSGGSTRVADRLNLPTVSVEGDRLFAQAVRKTLSVGSSVRLCAVDIGLTGEWAKPVLTKPTPGRVARWRAYVEAPFTDVAADRPFPDFVLVDGRFRRACALEATRRAQIAGASARIMFDDYHDVGRDHYAQVEGLLGRPERIGRSAVFRTDAAHVVSAEAVTLAIRDVR